jgi:hypothetical protein
VKATTDDSDGEMAALEEMIGACEFEIELPKERDESGYFSFTIPAEMVGEFSESVWEIDNGVLEDCIMSWNDEILTEAEAETE